MLYERLKTFRAVYDNMSFNKAAEHLQLTQSAISQQVSVLEAFYQVKLFVRKGRGIQFTPEGRALYEWTEDIVSSMEELPKRLRSLKNFQYGDGRLLVGATENAALVLSGYLESFGRNFPGIRIRITTETEITLKQKLLAKEFDFLAIDEIFEETCNTPLSSRTLTGGLSGFSLIVPSRHPWAHRLSILPEELANETFLMHIQDPSLRSYVEQYLLLNRVSLKHVIEVGNTDMIKLMVANGTGISIVGDRTIIDQSRGSRIKTVGLQGLEELKRRVWLFYPPHKEISYATWAFLRLMEPGGV